MGAQPYIVTDPRGIEIDGGRAYNPGDEVADDVVDRHDLKDQVHRAGTKAAEAVTTDPTA